MLIHAHKYSALTLQDRHLIIGMWGEIYFFRIWTILYNQPWVIQELKSRRHVIKKFPWKSTSLVLKYSMTSNGQVQNNKTGLPSLYRFWEVLCPYLCCPSLLDISWKCAKFVGICLFETYKWLSKLNIDFHIKFRCQTTAWRSKIKINSTWNFLLMDQDDLKLESNVGSSAWEECITYVGNYALTRESNFIFYLLNTNFFAGRVQNRLQEITKLLLLLWVSLF